MTTAETRSPRRSSICRAACGGNRATRGKPQSRPTRTIGPSRSRERTWPGSRFTGPGVVAVSSGADSVALLRALATWLKPLVVGHLNHRLRGLESDADEQFVRDLAKSLGLPCRTTAIDVAEEARRQSLLTSQSSSDRDALVFIDGAADIGNPA